MRDKILHLLWSAIQLSLFQNYILWVYGALPGLTHLFNKYSQFHFARREARVGWNKVGWQFIVNLLTLTNRKSAGIFYLKYFSHISHYLFFYLMYCALCALYTHVLGTVLHCLTNRKSAAVFISCTVFQIESDLSCSVIQLHYTDAATNPVLSTLTHLSPGQTVLPTQTNSSQVHNFDGVGYRLATHLEWVGSSWLEFDQAQIFAQLEPSFPPFGHLSQLNPTIAKLFCYCYVTTRS